MKTLLDLIGNTPLLDLGTLFNKKKNVSVFAKAEWLNPSGSLKDRPAKRILIEAIKMKRSSNSGGGLNVSYNINVPSLKDFSFASMPWEGGKNWVEAVETGVSGFNYYLAKASAASRSGTAIQIDGTLRAKTASLGIKYISKLIGNLKKRIGKKGKK